MATSPSSDISTVDICFFASACVSMPVSLSLPRVFLFFFFNLFFFFLAAKKPDSLIQIPDPYKSGGLYMPEPWNLFENRDTLAGPSPPVNAEGRGVGGLDK